MNRRMVCVLVILLCCLQCVGCTDFESTSSKPSDSLNEQMNVKNTETESGFIEIGMSMQLTDENGNVVRNNSKLEQKNYMVKYTNICDFSLEVTVCVLIDGLLQDTVQRENVEKQQSGTFVMNLAEAFGTDEEKHTIEVLGFYQTKQQYPKDELSFSTPGYNHLSYSIDLNENQLKKNKTSLSVNRIKDFTRTNWTIKIANQLEEDVVYRMLLGKENLSWYYSADESSVGRYAFLVMADGDIIEQGIFEADEPGIYQYMIDSDNLDKKAVVVCLMKLPGNETDELVLSGLYGVQ